MVGNDHWRVRPVTYSFLNSRLLNERFKCDSDQEDTRRDETYIWPAAAVIPAPIAYIKVAAVKKLVVGFLMRPAWPAVVTRVSAGCCPSVFL